MEITLYELIEKIGNTDIKSIVMWILEIYGLALLTMIISPFIFFGIYKLGIRIKNGNKR
jgi:hypothetical protein